MIWDEMTGVNGSVDQWDFFKGFIYNSGSKSSQAVSLKGYK